MADKNTEEKIPVVIPVDAEKLSRGLRLTFEGMSMVFDSIGTGCRISGEVDDPELVPWAKEDVRTGASEDAEAAVETVEKDAEKSTEKSAEKSTEETHEESEESAEESAAASAPAEETSTPAKTDAHTSPVTIDDITKIIVQKIKQNRKNHEAIGSILKTYGVAKVSELPVEKYEAFLTDLAAI